ncbi:MAG: DUF1934 domain-containing protein [Lachnospiraceae bacterium]
MTKEVLIRISGLQMMDSQDDTVEVITAGDYYQKNGKHYIIYDEVMEGFEGNTRNTLKIAPGTLDVRKHGVASAHMLFEQDKKSVTRYATPMGEMLVGISTNQIVLEEGDDALKVKVNYSLDINYEHMSDCNITLDVCSKHKAELRL